MAPQCGPTERVGRIGEQNSCICTPTRARVRLCGHTQPTSWHLLRTPAATTFGERLCQPISSEGWMRTRVLGYSPPIHTSLWGVVPANQRVFARRRSLPTKGCPYEEAETTNLLSRGWESGVCVEVQGRVVMGMHCACGSVSISSGSSFPLGLQDKIPRARTTAEGN